MLSPFWVALFPLMTCWLLCILKEQEAEQGPGRVLGRCSLSALPGGDAHPEQGPSVGLAFDVVLENGFCFVGSSQPGLELVGTKTEILSLLLCWRGVFDAVLVTSWTGHARRCPGTEEGIVPFGMSMMYVQFSMEKN